MKQLTIYVENKVGSLSALLDVIYTSDINVRSVSTERINLSEVRLIVDDAVKAQQKLESEGITSHVVDLVVVELDNKPGELVKVTKIIDDAGVNIEYIYGIDNGTEDKGLFAIMTTLDPDQLRNLLDDFTLL